MFDIPSVNYELRFGYYEDDIETSPVWPVEGQETSLYFEAATGQLLTSPAYAESEVSGRR